MSPDRALSSIYYHAHSVSPGNEGDDYVSAESRETIRQIALREPRARPLSLAECNQALVAAARAGTIGQFAARRGLVKLAGAGLLAQAQPLLNEFRLEPDDFPPTRDMSRADRESAAYETVSRAMRALGLDLCYVAPLPAPPPLLDEPNETLTLEVAVEANLSCEAVVHALDPQSWGTCNPYFRHAYTIEHHEGAYTRNLRPPRRDPAAPPIGSAWDGLVYEHFVLIENLVEFENVLRFTIVEDGDPQAPRPYAMEYRLDNSMYSKVYWSDMDCGFRRDDGCSEVTRIGQNVTRVRGVKHLRFAERSDRFLTPKSMVLGLTYLIHAFSDFAFDYGLCCR